MGNKIEFWAKLLDMLNSEEYPPVTNALKELCDSLHFGCGFNYEANHDGMLLLNDSYSLYGEDFLPRCIEPEKVLGPELCELLKQEKKIFFRQTSENKLLVTRMGKIFSLRSMAMVSVMNQEGRLIALLGIGDRRGLARVEEDDKLFTLAILTTLANHIKVRMYQKRIVTTQKALESIIESMGVDIYVNDFNTHEILYANSSMAEPYGGIENIVGKTCWESLYDDKSEECDYCPRKRFVEENRAVNDVYTWNYQRPFDGSWFQVLSVILNWSDGRLAILNSSVDITQNKKNEEIVRRMAAYDVLTNLPNRSRLATDCEAMITRAKVMQKEAFVIFFDLDGFKAINDRMGHHAGDMLLTRIGSALQENPLTYDRCYRYGGDEFVILCDGLAAERLTEVLDFLTNKMAVPFQLEGKEVACTVSIGISHCHHDGVEAVSLISKADQAMYACKSSREKGKVYFYNKGDICQQIQYPLAFSSDV